MLVEASDRSCILWTTPESTSNMPNQQPLTGREIKTSSSLKRLAWAYGCSKKGSDEEQRLAELLVEKVRDGE